MENEVWVSNAGVNLGAGGNQADPFRCNTPDSFGALLAGPLARPELSINLMPGLFQLPAFIKPWSGWKFHGAGIDRTILQLAPNTAPATQMAVMWGDPFTNTDRVEISDVTFDCNRHNQKNATYISAVSISGSNLRYSRVKAINWGSTKGEIFVLTMSWDGETPNVNQIIEDCIVTQPAPILFGSNGATAISIITENANVGNTRGHFVRRNQIYGINTGTGLPGSPIFFNALMHNAGGMCVENECWDLIGTQACGIYCDSWHPRDIWIFRNRITNVTMCCFFNMGSTNTNNLIIQNNLFRPAQNGSGINYYCGPDPVSVEAFVANAWIDGNAVYPADNVTNCNALSWLSGGRTSVITNNLLQGIGNGPDYRIPPATVGTNVFKGNYNWKGPI